MEQKKTETNTTGKHKKTDKVRIKFGIGSDQTMNPDRGNTNTRGK